jgi:maltooligosyltrehalose trehalohydrolase
MTALLLLGPQTPLLFMGQEFAASAPFLFFADHEPQLARLVATGRRAELSQFVNLADTAMDEALARPDDRATFERCKLDHAERARNASWWALHRDLLALRKTDPCFGTSGVPLDGAVLGENAFVLRFFAPDGMDRLLVVNLGRSLHVDPAPEPLLAPVDGTRWRVLWSSEDPRYGGISAPMPDAPEAARSPTQKPSVRWPRENWRFTGECAMALVPDSDPT